MRCEFEFIYLFARFLFETARLIVIIYGKEMDGTSKTDTGYREGEKQSHEHKLVAIIINTV